MRSMLIILVPALFVGAMILFVLSLRSGMEPQGCTVGSCPTELTAGNHGKTFIYRIGSRFTVVLNNDEYPAENLTCKPEGGIGYFANVAQPAEPYYRIQMEGQKTGSCILQNGSFQVRIVITDPTGG